MLHDPHPAAPLAPGARQPRSHSPLAWTARTARALACGLAACLASACITPLPTTGAPREAVLRAWGQPTSIYDMGQGASRLEYATGPYGKSTVMVDLDGQGRVTAAREVLTESNLMDFQGKAPGMQRDELLRTLGRPGQRRGGGWQGGEVWSWRYLTNECLWFQVSLGDDQRVRDGAFGIDPLCDKPGNT